MELEFAFFDAQSDGSMEDDDLRQTASAGSGDRKISSVQPGEDNVKDRGRFRGVHQRVSLLCVDFDDTLTDGDTTSLLVETVKAQVTFGCIICDVQVANIIRFIVCQTLYDHSDTIEDELFSLVGKFVHPLPLLTIALPDAKLGSERAQMTGRLSSTSGRN